MKRIILGVSAVLVALVIAASPARAFGLNDVVRMHEYGVPDSLIVLKIQHSGVQFHLDSGDLHKLQKAGVSNEVVGAMLATENPHTADGAVPVYVPVDPWYPFGPPYYPRVTVGLGYRYYGHLHEFPRAYLGPRPWHIAPGPRFKIGVSGSVHTG
jgi:hypothetical protein